MSFIVDKQTLSDLKILDAGKGKSIYALFNDTRTRGGGVVLEDMFRYPLSDVAAINARSRTIEYFMIKELGFRFNNEWFDRIESYLSNTDDRTKLDKSNDTIKQKFKNFIGADSEFAQIHAGVIATIGIVNTAAEFLDKYNDDPDSPFFEQSKKMREILAHPNLIWCVSEKNTERLSYGKTAHYDNILRYESNELLLKLLQYLYTIDVYTSVARIARERGFCFGSALNQDDNNVIEIESMYHPLLAGAVGNSITIDKTKNILFLTGANMAGKSTFMKTFGVTMFLAHMGFPLPAKKVIFTVQNGMYTTINLPDNLSMGYSHFYAEVLRLKKVAEHVSRTEHLIVIFDELFRGTNVLDAHEATVKVTQAFARRKGCTFIISTHIIEAGDDLKALCSNINYIYLPTILKENKPQYTYRIEPGITSDRHGMMIIKNERILETLRSRTRNREK